MKIIVDREPLMLAIGNAARAAEKQDTIPILAHALLKPGGQSLGIIGNNLHMQIETTCPADISANGGSNHGNIAVLAAPLDGLIKRAPDGAQIIIEYDEPAAGVVIKAGRSRYTLRALPADDFPAFPEMKDASTFSLDSAEFVQALQKVQFAINRADARVYCQGAYLHPADNSLSAFGGSKTKCLALVATDGHCLARLALPAVSVGGNLKPPIISDATIAEIIHLLDGEKDEAQISVSPSLISISCTAGIFTSKLLDATYPEYERVIPTPGDHQAIIDCKDIMRALERLRLVEGSAAAQFAFSDGALKLTMESAERGAAVEEISVEWEGNPITVGLSGHCMLELFGAMKTDQCVMRISDPQSAVLIQPWRAGVVDTSQTFVRMPMRF